MIEAGLRAAERAARDSYGRLVAYLAARTRDVAAAEDALGDALAKALDVWPRDGIPEAPEAWLLTVARRRLIDAARARRVRQLAEPHVAALLDERARAAGAAAAPDERLALLFVCAHPAIAADLRTPLMLQVVLGIDAARIASAFLVAPGAMAKRLVRAKARIRDARIPFAVPAPDAWPERLDAVLDAIYAAYGSGWADPAGADARSRDLVDESVWLAEALAAMLPAEPEVLGLYALVLHCEARRAARRDSLGRYIPLTEQDVALWDAGLIERAEGALLAASRSRRPGRYQLEAAIQSALAARLRTGSVPWPTVVELYGALFVCRPVLGVLAAWAAAHGENGDPQAGLRLLDRAEHEAPVEASTYQPFWAVRAHLAAQVGDESALGAYERAIGLSEDPAVRAFLQTRLAAQAGPRDRADVTGTEPG